MTSFRRTTYLLLSLFVFGFFCSFYAEAQRVRGKRMRGGEKPTPFIGILWRLIRWEWTLWPWIPQRKKNPWMRRSFMRQAILLSLQRMDMRTFMGR